MAETATPTPDTKPAETATAAAKPAKTVAKVDHLKDCPKTRGETYEAPGKDGKPVKVERCIDCGARRRV